MTPEELKKVKDFLMFLKVARRTEPIMCIAMLAGDEFKPHVKIIEDLVGWSDDDNKEADRLANEGTKNLSSARTLPEKSHRMSKWLYGLFASLAVAGAVGGYAYYKKRKENGNGNNKSAEK